MKKVISYIKEAYNELVHKVSWPTRPELSSSTVIVMVASILMAAVVFVIDYSFEWIVSHFYRMIFKA